MGHVFVGEHTLLGRRAAIKTLQPAVSANREVAERFFNEARATSAISDPGVIQIFDFGYHVDGTAYIVMELLEGETLSARIDRCHRLALGDALRIARQIAGSLSAAHACDIIHRDLKPENIFLVRDAETQGGERTKILDFGICKVATREPTLTQSGAMIGTPVYMSPEQCRAAGEVDHRADIYAFGCLVFHMIAGRPPFVGEAPGDLIVAHLREDAPPASRYVPGLPAAVDVILKRCLAKSPGDRFASMGELQDALGELSARLDAQRPAVATSTTSMTSTIPRGREPRSGSEVARWGLGSSRITRPRWSRARSTPPPMRADAAREERTPPAWLTPVPDERLPGALAPATPPDERYLLALSEFRAAAPDDATTRRERPKTVAPRFVTPASAERTLTVRRSRRAVVSYVLVLGSLVCLLATSLDDGAAIDAPPAPDASPIAVTSPAPAELPVAHEAIEITVRAVAPTDAAVPAAGGGAGPAADLLRPAHEPSRKTKRGTAKSRPRMPIPPVPRATLRPQRL